MEIRLDSLKPYIDEKVKEAVEDTKHGFIEAMRTDLMKLPYTYKGFPSDRTKYIKRDDVLKILDKHTEESEDKE